MGSAASKKIDDTVLGECTLHEGNADAMFDEAVTTTVLKNITGKGASYIHAGTGKTLVAFRDKGTMTKKHTQIVCDDRIVAHYIATKKGMASCSSLVLRETPAFEGQDPVPGDRLRKAGLEQEMELYEFAKLDMTKPSMSTAKSVYSIVTGEGGFRVLYVAENENCHCVVTTVDDVPVLKHSMIGMSSNIAVEVSAGVDIAAAMLAGFSTFSTDGTAGGLMGAGVI